jgi:hypothetical protein
MAESPKANSLFALIHLQIVQLFSCSKGRRDWWTDYKYRDPSLKTGRWRLQRPRFESEDRWWFDPPVKDGTSLVRSGFFILRL